MSDGFVELRPNEDWWPPTRMDLALAEAGRKLPPEAPKPGALIEQQTAQYLRYKKELGL